MTNAAVLVAGLTLLAVATVALHGTFGICVSAVICSTVVYVLASRRQARRHAR